MHRVEHQYIFTSQGFSVHLDTRKENGPKATRLRRCICRKYTINNLVVKRDCLKLSKICILIAYGRIQKNRRQIVININYIKESIKPTPLAKFLLIKSDVSFRIELLRKQNPLEILEKIQMHRYVNCSFILQVNKIRRRLTFEE